MNAERRHVVENLARGLMEQHGLTAQGWRFGWDGARRRFGACHWGPRMITLSVHLVDLNDDDRVRLTVLHEIAHALAGPHHGHDRHWRRICLSIGGNGQRCYSEANTVAPKGKLQATCGRCGHVFHRFRSPRARTWCGKCGIRPAHHPELALQWQRA